MLKSFWNYLSDEVLEAFKVADDALEADKVADEVQNLLLNSSLGL